MTNDSQTTDTDALAQWWLEIEGKPDGPHTEAYVLTLLENGRIETTSLACPAGGNQWKPLHEWPEFSEVIAGLGRDAAPPPLPASLATARREGLLTNPRLPRMANWICIYCIAVYPLLTVVNCLFSFACSTASDFPNDSPAVWSAVTYDAIVILIDIGIAVAVVMGGVYLRRLCRIGATIIKVSFIVDFSCMAIGLLTATLWSALAAVVTSPVSTEEELTDSSAILLVLCGLPLVLAMIAVLIFQIVAFIWLLRHERELPLVSD